MRPMKPDKEISVSTIRIPTASGSIPALVLAPKTGAENAVGVLWIHGGGYIAGMKEMVHASRAVDLVKKFGAVVVSPGYRLAVQRPYPAAAEDCYSALIYMKNHDWGKARRTLKKAARIDKTNTTTLRFLREVDERTGVTTRLEKQKKGLFGAKGKTEGSDEISRSTVVQPAVYRENSRISLFVTLMAGVAAGAAAFWFLAVPAIKQGIYREANQQIVKYSESLVSQGAELSKAQGEAKESGDVAEEITQQLDAEQKKSTSYQALLNAYAAYTQNEYDAAALEIQKVYEDQLGDDVMGIYNTICSATGVSGITEDSKSEGSEDSSDSESNDGTDNTTEGSETDSSGYDSSYNDASGDSGYDESGYSDYSDENGYYDENGDFQYYE